MIFSFLTLFPQLIESYFQDSILKNARQKGLITIQTIQLRNFALNAYKSVDAPQIGGGAGQVLNAQVIDQALQWLCNHTTPITLKTNSIDFSSTKESNNRTSSASFAKRPHIIFLTPSAKRFTQNDSIRLAKKNHIAFVCGRYEGIDERAIEMWADEVLCIGDFIITGGELGALCLCDSISRQIPGVLGNTQSLQGESFENSLLEAPIFARTNILNPKFAKFIPPSEYSKGNHSRIAGLKNHLALCKTRYFRPDLFERWKTIH